MTYFKQLSSKFTTLMKLSAHDDRNIATQAQMMFAKAIEEPLREAVLTGNIVNMVFQPEKYEVNEHIEYQLSLLTPGTEGDYVAFVTPGIGYIPHRMVSADRVSVPTYEVSNAIDCAIRSAESAKYSFVEKMLARMQEGFVKKTNDDAFHTLIMAALDRNILVHDADASAGQFTRRLYSLMRTTMMRNSGGNSASANQGKLTDIIASPETTEDMRNWSLQEVADAVREKFWMAEGTDGPVRIGKTLIHELQEFGVGQEYQSFYTAQGGTMGGSDTEIILGLDLSTSDSFFMPVRKTLTIWPDENRHRWGQISYYGKQEHGFAVLDNRRVMLGSY